MLESCGVCKKEYKVGDQVYQEGYFGQNYCSWECLVDSMAEFFSVKKGETNKYIGDGEVEYDEY